MSMFTTIDKIVVGDLIHVRNDVLTIKVEEVFYEKDFAYAGSKPVKVYRVKGVRRIPYIDDSGVAQYTEHPINTTLDNSIVILKVSE